MALPCQLARRMPPLQRQTIASRQRGVPAAAPAPGAGAQLAAASQVACGCSTSGGASTAAATSAGSGYWTLTTHVLYEEEVKKSKFIVRAWPVDDGAQAMARVRSAADAGASHNCFAYRVGDDCRSSDDGEPSGTAGRPMLSAIDSEGLDRVCVLVTRYFGGVKLGTGGLARAYGGAARECLKLAPRVFVKRKIKLTVEAPYADLGTVYGSIDKLGCQRLAEEYGAAGTVTVQVLVEVDHVKALQAAVVDGTNGRCRAQVLQEGEGDSHD